MTNEGYQGLLCTAGGQGNVEKGHKVGLASPGHLGADIVVFLCAHEATWQSGGRHHAHVLVVVCACRLIGR